MLRRVLRKEQFGYEDCRGMTPSDRRHFDWLVGNGFFEPAGAGAYGMTEKGKASAELGMYEWP